MLLHKMLEVQLSSGRDAIAEMNFYVQHDTPRILSLVSRLSSKLVQVDCSAGDEVLVAGYVARSEAGGRHPAHFDSENIEDLVKKLADRARAHLELNAPFISVDNSDFSDVGMAMVVAEICRFLTV